MGELALFYPAVALALVVATFAGRRVGRVFAAGAARGWLVVASLGLVVAATLTPLRSALETGARSTGTCDLSRMTLAPISELVDVTDTSLNVLLFVPLGVATALLPPSRRRTGLLAASIALPFAIEGTQLLVPALGRGCQSADVVDNLTGLAIGLVVGWLGRRALGFARRGR